MGIDRMVRHNDGRTLLPEHALNILEDVLAAVARLGPVGQRIRGETAPCIRRGVWTPAIPGGPPQDGEPTIGVSEKADLRGGQPDTPGRRERSLPSAAP